MKYIGQILPVDGYSVTLKKTLPTNYLQSFTHLYQPLIGSEAMMLYQTLLHDIDLSIDEELQTHHTLMNYLMLSLDKIYEARIKLEAVGLLKTYRKTMQETAVYTYELQQPLTPGHFFQEPIFATLLYNHIGEQRYLKLQKFFKQENTQQPGDNITMEFQDVFQTFTPNLSIVEHPPEKKPDKEPGREEYLWLEQMLKQRMIPVGRVLTKENRKLISQMLLLYDLETFEIDKAILWSLTDENYLNTIEFKHACHDLFKAKNNNVNLQLERKMPDRKQPKKQDKAPLTKEESLIQQLEAISPKQLLEDLSGGNLAPEQDLKLIREVMTSQGLTPAVMNVLIYYVLLQTNMKLTKGYLEKIAGQWSRAQLKTAREAMDFAKKEKANYDQAKANRSPRYQKPVKKDVVPNWFKEGKHLQSKPEETTRQKMTDNQLKIANLIKQYSEGN